MSVLTHSHVFRDLVRAAALNDPTVTVGSTPTGIALGTTTAYVANQGSNTVSVIDLSQNPPIVTATIPVGSKPDAAALSADGTQLFVPDFGAAKLSIISTATNTVTHTVTVGKDPNGTVEAGGLVYVANLLGTSISVVNPSTGTVVRTIRLPTGMAPSGLAASSDGHTLYADDSRNGKTDVIDLTQNPPVVTGSVSVGSHAAYLSVAGSTGYVAAAGANAISVLDLSQSPPVLSGSVTVGNQPYGVFAVPSLKEVFATNSGSNTVSVIDTSSGIGSVAGSAAVGSVPDAIAVSPDNQTAMISNESSGNVSVFHVNQTPVNTVPGAQNVDANGSSSTHNQLTFSGGHSNLISTSDSDAGSNPVQVTLSVGHGTISLSGSSGLSFTSGLNGSSSMTFTGSLSDVNAALAGLTYEPATGFLGSDTLNITDDDLGNTGLGTAQSATSTVSISVNNVGPSVGNESYSGAVGNTTFGVGTSPSGPAVVTSGSVLSNSTDANGDTLTAGPSSITTVGGGSVSMNSDGSFTYNPKAGFTGNDTFSFQVSDGHATTTGTATVSVSNMVWYVNDNNGSNGSGTSVSPFNTLSSVSGTGTSNPSGSGDTIFLYGSATSYGGGIVLKGSQTLDSQSVGLSVGGNALVAPSGSNPTITNSGGAGITLGEGDTVKGITVSGTSGAGVSASGVNAFTLDSSDAISGTTGTGLSISGGSGTISNGAAITTSSSHSLTVSGRTGGTVTSSGAISDSGQGISLTSNTGATVAFTGKLTASTGSNTAFSATGGGTVSATAAGSSLQTSGAPASLNVSSTTIGSPGLSFQSISASGDTNGIVLSTTGTSGSLSVTGTGAAASGGTISSATGDAISLSSTSSPSFNDMSVTNPAHDGVDGTGVHGFTFTNGSISGAGSLQNTATDSAIAFNNNSPIATNDNVDGAVTITGNALTNPYGSGVDILGYNGTISDANISNNTISSTTTASTSKGSGIGVNLFGNASTVANLTKAEIQNNAITNFPSGNGITVQGGDSQSAGAPSGAYGTPGDPSRLVSITGNLVHGTATGECFSGTSGCINGQAINVSVVGHGQGNFAVSSNGTSGTPVGENVGVTLGVFFAGNVNANASITGNVIKSNNSLGAVGLAYDTAKWTLADNSVATGTGFTTKATITGNSVSNYDGIGLRAIQEDSNLTTDLNVSNNTVSGPESDNKGNSGIEIDEGTGGSASFNPSMCAQISGNTAAASNPDNFGDVFPGISLTKRSNTSSTYAFGITGLSPSPSDEAGTENYVGGQNPASGSGNVSLGSQRVFASPGAQWTSCTLPTMP